MVNIDKVKLVNLNDTQYSFKSKVLFRKLGKFSICFFLCSIRPSLSSRSAASQPLSSQAASAERGESRFNADIARVR